MPVHSNLVSRSFSILPMKSGELERARASLRPTLRSCFVIVEYKGCNLPLFLHLVEEADSCNCAVEQPFALMSMITTRLCFDEMVL
ncbi:hypothetical protein HNR39_002960 [Glaciimonas immobilis]|uniref:Uncharacterized protein n=1 Tax=Glaciimonas immobilis TaxID=728004 RepID=A0A840RX37_9BURK|nr:hypothetical protein [Glaciimonas immobilis]